MPADPVSVLQLHLFACHSPAYQEALVYYEEIRPILKRERTLAQQSRATGLNYWRLWRHLRRFRRDGLLGLIDRRKLLHPWGKTSIEERLPRHIQQHLVQLAIAHPFTDRELARIIQLVLWTLEIMHAVWRMPPYRWSRRPQRVLRTRQLSLFDGFAP